MVFFEFLFVMCWAWRLAWERDDMMAVIACFTLGAVSLVSDQSA
jgi:hypothetical protein